MSVFFRFGTETPEIKQKRVEACKKAYQAKQKILDEDPNSWWNKVRDITFGESVRIPMGELEKYKEIYNSTHEFYEEVNLRKKNSDRRYQEHFGLHKLLSDKEKEDKALKNVNKADEDISPNKLSTEFNMIQPRNTNIPNYNFEQYKGFTRLYNEQLEKDRQKRLEIKRIYKYIKQNPDEPLSKHWKRKLLYGQGSEDYDINKIGDDNVSIEGFKPPVPRKARRAIIKTRTSRDITNYDCWRTFDRKIYVDNYHLCPTSKIILSPSQLIHCFGHPEWCPTFNSSGIYHFEDNNLDVFVIAEPNLTTQTRGENKDKEYYNLQKATVRKRNRDIERPSLEEFWFNDQQRVFFLFTTHNAQFRKFKVWLRKYIEEGITQPSFREKAEQKYGHMFNHCDQFDQDYSKFNDVGADKMGALNFSWADFLDKKEQKKYKNEIPDKIIPPQYIPVNEKTKLNLSRADLEEMILVEKEKLKADTPE